MFQTRWLGQREAVEAYSNGAVRLRIHEDIGAELLQMTNDFISTRNHFAKRTAILVNQGDLKRPKTDMNPPFLPK